MLINEAGLYRLILRSNTPKTEECTDVVCSEILPSVRKLGHTYLYICSGLPRPRETQDAALGHAYGAPKGISKATLTYCNTPIGPLNKHVR